MTESAKELVFWVSAFLTIVAAFAVVARGKKSVMKSAEEYVCNEVERTTKTQSDALVALVAFEIVKAHQNAVHAQEIPRHVIAPIESLYKAYTALGGNGYIGRLIADIRNLPLCDDYEGSWRDM